MTKKQLININYREALQTLGDTPHQGSSILNPELDPPCSLNFNQLDLAIKSLSSCPNLIIELPPPISSPTQTKKISAVFKVANQYQVGHQVALHTRLAWPDVQLAIDCGARHLYVLCCLKPIHDRTVSLSQILHDLHSLIDKCNQYIHEPIFFRVSLEHATETDPQTLHAFITSLIEINNSSSHTHITGLGLPDTQGCGTPQLFKEMLNAMEKLLLCSQLTMSIHLHDDFHNAKTNLKFLINYYQQHNIPHYIEITPALYPGERNGIRPSLDEIQVTIDNVFNNVIIGPSWVEKKYPEKAIMSGHVAGLHTFDMLKHSNSPDQDNFASPGLYTIMGSGNLAFLQSKIFNKTAKESINKSAALIGRELASQLGNQKQKWAISLAKIAFENPELIKKASTNIGNPTTWLHNPTPNLNQIQNQLSSNS